MMSLATCPRSEILLPLLPPAGGNDVIGNYANKEKTFQLHKYLESFFT
ncbi:MAG: hypothetical protein GX121_07010 [Ignavibacteria bacterium]|nr:hypothetical protein [Ignavibacteria bacterium]